MQHCVGERSNGNTAGVTEEGQRWQAVDPQDRDGRCDHTHRYDGQDTNITVCLLCGTEVEPVMAELVDLDMLRWHRRRRLWG